MLPLNYLLQANHQWRDRGHSLAGLKTEFLLCNSVFSNVVAIPIIESTSFHKIRQKRHSGFQNGSSAKLNPLSMMADFETASQNAVGHGFSTVQLGWMPFPSRPMFMEEIAGNVI